MSCIGKPSRESSNAIRTSHARKVCHTHLMQVSYECRSMEHSLHKIDWYIGMKKLMASASCGLPDGQKHRHWECEALEPARSSCPTHIRKWVNSSSPVVGNHGWIPTPESLQVFRKELDNITDDTNDFQHCDIQGELDLFTDGSCLQGKCKLSRIGSWGVVAGSLDDPDKFVPISCGLIPGRSQTSIRAELTACLSAIRFATFRNQKFRIWTDSSYTIKRLTIAQRKQGSVFDNQANNHDLLSDISVAIWEAREVFLGIHKVCSHQEHSNLCEAEQWVCRGNDWVDELAKNAFASYPNLMRIWTQLCSEISFLTEAKRWVHRVHVETGRLAVKLQTKQRTQILEPWYNDDLQTEGRYDQWNVPETLPDHLPKFHIHDWSALQFWVRSLHDPGGRVFCLSWFQLTADLGLQKPEVGPWYHNENVKIWKSGFCRPQSSFAKKTRWLADYLIRLCKLLDQPLPTQFCRPDSYTLAFRTSCLTVRMATTRFEAIERWLQQYRHTFMKPSDLNFMED